MSNINRVVVSGNLTKDPELRMAVSGTAILNGGIAVSERRKNASTGQYDEYTNFVDWVLMGKRAEALSQILQKGMKVVIEGRLRWSQWEKDGQRRSKLEVMVDEVELLQGGGKQQAPQQQSAQVFDYGEDIPF